MKLENIKSLLLIYTKKTGHVIHVRNLQQPLNHGLVLKKVHRLIKFNQKGWLKLFMEMNTKLR